MVFLEECKQREKIQLEYNNIQKNPGKKATAKLMLNSFWGKFGERPDKTTTQTLGQAHQLYKLLMDGTVEVRNIRICSEEVLEIQYTKVLDSTPPNPKTNIFIAAFTTCYGRLKLYEHLEALG